MVIFGKCSLWMKAPPKRMSSRFFERYHEIAVERKRKYRVYEKAKKVSFIQCEKTV